MNMKVMDVPAAPPKQDPLDALFDAMFRPMNAQGVYARTGAYESVVEALAALISSKRDAETEVFRFPPVMSRAHLERHGYLKSFPNLLGCVSCLEGSEAEIRAAADLHAAGGDWTAELETADLVLTPAACYPVYPIAAARGPVPAGGYRFDVACDCFRREPSPHLDRLQSFRMREYVRIGTPDEVRDFREHWITRATALADELGLPYRIEQASDPFFGRVGQIMAFSQLEQSLKFELLVPLRGEAAGTACMSFNYHREHFGTTWDLRDADGEPAHTGCVAFGMDRLAVALFATHGRDVADWPEPVRAALRL
ncbi:amino acid--[acyl-carrier-protein] ligase [Methylobacterium durans]|uniref:amino acid--[acyl-carrier-protein] ligase n=1 Tax=Methylobacterium durans TaxID=2202825 RepID=UPI002AFE68CC|nr:amino acid--[acyl-carrier-protein] ligase [Methylobacterium durans]MEA1834498.1 amino acid--[acyl-carrier-protein] ligase [Methylobacterium durans]